MEEKHLLKKKFAWKHYPEVRIRCFYKSVDQFGLCLSR
jgi:hypothetical protein